MISDIGGSGSRIAMGGDGIGRWIGSWDGADSEVVARLEAGYGGGRSVWVFLGHASLVVLSGDLTLEDAGRVRELARQYWSMSPPSPIDGVVVVAGTHNGEWAPLFVAGL